MNKQNYKSKIFREVTQGEKVEVTDTGIELPQKRVPHPNPRRWCCSKKRSIKEVKAESPEKAPAPPIDIEVNSANGVREPEEEQITTLVKQDSVKHSENLEEPPGNQEADAQAIELPSLL